eukprot:TRINITY_DN4201_c0_g3_i1.p1 TRINITY_DN4201_c0_g3~~TRINITY_DN4201_c0_g3_i1.p1  ORF type:complete len:405 (+),score=56.38 TRINITY_DN4201_c0_g3_i1:190-1404(+)
MSSDEENHLSSVEEPQTAASFDASLNSASEENDEREQRQAQPHWLLNSPFLIPDDESEEGILDAGGRDGSDRYVALPGAIPAASQGKSIEIFSIEQVQEIQDEFGRLWSLWDAAERKRFWLALQRCGRLQPREISKRVGTKTPEQVSRILFYLEVLKIEKKPYRIKRLPHAEERTSEQIAAEEKRNMHKYGMVPEDSQVFAVEPEMPHTKETTDDDDGEAPSRHIFSSSSLKPIIGRKTLSDGAKSRIDASVRTFLRKLIRSAAYFSVERAKNTHGTHNGQGDASKMSLEADWSHILPSPKSTRVDITGYDVQVAINQHKRTLEEAAIHEDLDESGIEPSADSAAPADDESASTVDKSPSNRQTRSKAKNAPVEGNPQLPPARGKRGIESTPDIDEPKSKRRKI